MLTVGQKIHFIEFSEIMDSFMSKKAQNCHSGAPVAHAVQATGGV